MSTDPNSTVEALYARDVTLTNLGSEIWHSCPPIHITHYWTGAQAPTERHAEARLCWNDEGLTVRFVCEQREPLIVTDNPVTHVKTVGLWDRDVCEIFIAPNYANTNQYFEFEAAPTGEWIDLGIQFTSSGRETEWDYTSGMTTVNKIVSEQVMVAITIPWSERIPKPNRGDEWKANLFRCVGPDEATRYLAWRPTRTPEPNFHVPGAFGVLRFV